MIAGGLLRQEVQLYVGDALGRYGFPHGHPFGPDRQDAFWKEAEKQGVPRRVELREPREASRDEIERFHKHEHVERVRVLSVEGARLRVSDLEAIDGTPVVDIKVAL